MTADLDKDEAELLPSYADGPRIWDAAAIFPVVLSLAGKGLIEPADSNGRLYRITRAGADQLAATAVQDMTARKDTAMYPSEGSRPLLGAKTGDKIAHKLMPGFTMVILGTRPCETDSSRPGPHDQYKIIDPGRNEDWLCAYDVLPAG